MNAPPQPRQGSLKQRSASFNGASLPVQVEEQATISTSNSYGGLSKQHSSLDAQAKSDRHDRTVSNDVHMDATEPSVASVVSLAPRHGTHHSSRRALQLAQRSIETTSGVPATLDDPRRTLAKQDALRVPSAESINASIDDEMSEADSDWRSSSADGSSRRMSSKTETEEDEYTSDVAKEARLMSSDEEEEDDEVGSDDESVVLNDLDPDCLISLPPEINELARNKVAQVCLQYEEQVLRPAVEKQALERQTALEKGDISPEMAAHDDELQLMGLDPDEVRDTSMVAEYSHEIFEYMSKCECRTMANPNYMDFQGEIRWHMRATLVDWLMQVHMRYHMMPETLWIAINVVDRFLSARVVSLAKLQLVGVTAMFIAAKYEEIMSPVVDEFVFMTESGYTRDEILKGERIILSTLDFNISTYCSPYSWVRRISKADDYDIQTRTLAKFLMELTLFDHRFLRAKPSHIAAIGMYLSKKMLGGQWNEGFVYYSNYIEEQLIPGASLLLERLVDDSFLDCFVCKKYGNRKFLKASIYARDWALRNQDTMIIPSSSSSSNVYAHSDTTTPGTTFPSAPIAAMQ